MTKLGLGKLHICPKVTKMGSIIGHRIDCNGVGALKGQRHIPSKNYPKYPHPPPPRGGMYTLPFLIQQTTVLMQPIVLDNISLRLQYRYILYVLLCQTRSWELVED